MDRLSTRRGRDGHCAAASQRVGLMNCRSGSCLNFIQPRRAGMLRPRGAIELLQETLIGEAAATGSAGVVLSDDDLRYVAVNEAACNLLGYSRGELLASRCPMWCSASPTGFA